MQCTSACDDCVVTYLVRNDHSSGGETSPASATGLALDGEQARVVELFGAAGMVPRLRYTRQQVAG